MTRIYLTGQEGEDHLKTPWKQWMHPGQQEEPPDTTEEADFNQLRVQAFNGKIISASIVSNDSQRQTLCVHRQAVSQSLCT